MVQISLFLLFIIFCKGHSSLTISSITPYKTVPYGSAVTVECSGTDVTWSCEPATDEKKENGNTLTISRLTKSTDVTCSKSGETATATINVINVAGVSSSDCRTKCEVSCALYPLENKPTDITWSSSNIFQGLEEGKFKEVDNGNADKPNTKYTHRSDEYKYNSQQTNLVVENLTDTTYLTCSFTLTDTSVVQHTVSALIRPTNECHMGKVCVTKDKCHSMSVTTTDATCRDDCQKCFTYEYKEGDFIEGTGQCFKDIEWCNKYLDDRKKCSDIEKDPIASYCNECGNCLQLEFTSSKLILPMVILLMLCLLTILMCYKSYEEKRSVLPKVHVTNSDPAASQYNRATKFVPQVSMVKENRCASDEHFKLKVKSKGTTGAAPTNGADVSKQSSQII